MPALLVALVTALGLFAASPSPAALTADGCLAAKRAAHGTAQQCRAAESAKALLGRTVDLASCTTKLQAKLAKLDAKAVAGGLECRFRDNGDRTITDYDTGLMWEQKQFADGLVNPLDVHDADNTYTLSASYGETIPNGTVFTDFLAELDRCTSADGLTLIGGFAGHCDWHLPTIAELRTIRLESFPCERTPCTDPAFDPTIAGPYWSSTPFDPSPANAWHVSFATGLVEGGGRYNAYGARAVRPAW